MKNLLLAGFIVAISFACNNNSAPSDRSVSKDREANQASVPTTSSANHNAADHSTMNHSGMENSPGAASAPYDLQFIDTMSAHHQGAIDMAKLAETRTQRPEMKELAANIINDQEREIATMSKLRDRWFAENTKAVNSNFPGMSHGMGGMDLKKLESLKGSEFDIEFLKQMIPHHEGAIEMARDLQKQDANAELKALAGDIITAQEAEIKQMREWLRRF